jgi:heme-degrading monooxygenase HmoA
MYIILWEYHVRTENIDKFKNIYSASGAWANLFQKASGYLGTELLQDETSSVRFLTIDRWDSKQSYETFHSQWEKEYKTLDQQCEGLTENEVLLGKWESL